MQPADAAVLDVVVRNWPLTGVSIVGTKRSTNQVIHLRTDQGEFAVKVGLTPWRHGATERLPVLTDLAERGFVNAPRLTATTGGGLYVTDDQRSLWILEFIPCDLSHGDGMVAAETWRAMGHAAARLNAITDCRYEFMSIGGQIEELRQRASGAPLPDAYRALLETVTMIADAPPLGLIHGELNPWNAGRRADGTVVFLDWDQAGVGPTCVEYGYPLITHFLSKDDHHLDYTCASAFYAGYTDAGGVVDPELLFLAALYQAMRYMWFGGADEPLRRWRRIEYAVANRDEMLSVLPR